VISIYGLVERGKDINHIRYIGLTQDPAVRLSSHRSTVENTEKGKWIAGLRDQNRTIEMILLDSADTKEDAHVKENAWIIFARSRGWPITNGTDPGEHRAILDPEVRSIEDVVSSMIQLKADMESRIDNLRNEMSADANRLQSRLSEIDTHFNRWYRFILGLVLTTVALTLSYLAVRNFSYYLLVADLGVLGAGVMLVAHFCVYPLLLFTLWFFIKDVPLYKPGVGTSSWFQSLEDYQLSSLSALKRIFFHSFFTVLILFLITWFDTK
jgi:predicted GIY-YIG superfamily endonuclease